MKERKAFPLRLDPALYKALERWAQQEMRSVNGQIEFLLKQAVDRREGAAKPRPRESDGRTPGDPAPSDRAPEDRR